VTELPINDACDRPLTTLAPNRTDDVAVLMARAQAFVPSVRSLRLRIGIDLRGLVSAEGAESEPGRRGHPGGVWVVRGAAP
jgi:hypothetical protein